MFRPSIGLRTLATAILACAFAALPHAHAQQHKEVKIGVIYDYTGPFAAGGSQAAALGTKIAIDMINEKGGVEGYKIVPIYADAQSKADAFTEANPGRLIKVRYEDLLADAPAAAPSLFEHLGVNASPDAVAGAIKASSFETLSGRKPGEENPRSFFRKGVAGDWKGRLDDAALGAISQRCSTGMERENYTLDA